MILQDCTFDSFPLLKPYYLCKEMKINLTKLSALHLHYPVFLKFLGNGVVVFAEV